MICSSTYDREGTAEKQYSGISTKPRSDSLFKDSSSIAFTQSKVSESLSLSFTYPLVQNTALTSSDFFASATVGAFFVPTSLRLSELIMMGILPVLLRTLLLAALAAGADVAAGAAEDAATSAPEPPQPPTSGLVSSSVLRPC